MGNSFLEQDEVMKMVADVIDSASDTKSARAGIVNLVNNPAYNIANPLKSIFLHVVESDENFLEFKNNMVEVEDNKEPVIIPETNQNVFFDKMMSRRIQRARLLENRIIVPYIDNNKQFIYALMNGSTSNNFSFILTNLDSKANFVLSSSIKNADNEQFYSKMNELTDKVDTNANYLQIMDAELGKMVQLFDTAVNSDVNFNIGLTPRENGREIIISLGDSSYEERLRSSGIEINDGKIRITNDFFATLDRVDKRLSQIDEHIDTNINAVDYSDSNSIGYSIYDSKKADGTDIKTEIYQEVNGSHVYMSTNIGNLEASVNVRRDYLFTSKDIFYSSLAQFFRDEDLLEKKKGIISEKNDQALSCVFVLEDGRRNVWGESVSIDNYSEVTNLYSQLDTLPSLKDAEALENSQGNSMGGQVLVKNNPALPPILPSQEKTTGGINNSGFSSTFLFVTIIALEITAIVFGIFMFVK